MTDPTIHDEIVSVLAEMPLPLRVDQQYNIADRILAEVTKTDRLVNQGKVYRVIETDWADGNDEHKTFTVYTRPEAEEIR
jgi:hypothetical protein